MGKSFKLRNGLLLLSTEAPGGVYNASQLRKIAALCEGDSAIAKATEDQRLAIFAPTERAAVVAKELRSVGLGVRHYQDGLHQPVNCIGELCGEHQQDAMGTSMDLARALGGITLTAAPLKIGINGCGRCCVPTHTLDISVVGETQGYRVSLGGRNAQLPELATYMAEGIPAAELPDLLTKIVTLYKMLAQAGENLQALIERVGSKPFIEALAPYSQDGFGAEVSSSGGDLDPLPDLSESFGNSVDSVDAAVETSDEEALETEMEATEVALEAESVPGYDEILPDGPPDGVSLEGVASLDEPGASHQIPSHQATNPAARSDQDLERDLLDGMPGFDPSLDMDHAAAGPTIDSYDLLGENHGGANIGLEPELLSEELPHQDAMSILDEPDASFDKLVDDEDRDPFGAVPHDAALGEGPLAPVEEDFDAQEALSDNFDDIELVAAEASLESEVAVVSLPDDLSLEEAAGIEPIRDPIPPNPSKPHPKPVAQEVASAPEKAADDLDVSAFDDDLTADVIEGPEAEALEAKLAASIAAEESAAPEADENAEARFEALSMITGGEGLPSVGGVVEALETPTDFSDLEIDAEPMMADDFTDSEVDLGDGDFEEHSDEDDRPAPSMMEQEELVMSDNELSGVAPASPQISSKEPQALGANTPPKEAAEKTTSSPDKREPQRSDPKPARPAPVASGFALSGVDLTGEGRISLAFASGVSLVVDPRTIAPGMTKGINFGGQRINITSEDHGLNVEVDGVTIFLPTAAA